MTDQVGTSKHRNIHAVMFDLGDTLFSPLPASHVGKNLYDIAIQTPLETTPADLMALFRSTRAILEREFSKFDFYLHRDFIEEVISRLFNSLGFRLPRKLAQRFCDSQKNAVTEHLQPRSDCFKTLTRIRDLGFKLAIVSNIDNEWLDPLRNKWSLDDFVDVCLSSEDARSCKPDRTIFLRACSLCEVASTSTVFVGDSQTNDFFGSRDVGMHPIWFDKTQSGDESAVTPAVTSLAEVIGKLEQMQH